MDWHDRRSRSFLNLSVDFFSHSSSRKCVHLSHRHHPHSASNNKLLPFLNHPHSFSVNVHHSHLHHKLLKQSFASLPLWPCHRDRSSLNAFHLRQRVHVSTFSLGSFFQFLSFLCSTTQVTSSSNVGSHTVLRPNEKPSFNALKLPKGTPDHATSSFNMKALKFALSDNSNAWVLLKRTHKPIFNDMALNCSMLKPWCNKLALLVLLRISYVPRFIFQRS